MLGGKLSGGPAPYVLLDGHILTLGDSTNNPYYADILELSMQFNICYYIKPVGFFKKKWTLQDIENTGMPVNSIVAMPLGKFIKKIYVRRLTIYSTEEGRIVFGSRGKYLRLCDKRVIKRENFQGIL